MADDQIARRPNGLALPCAAGHLLQLEPSPSLGLRQGAREDVEICGGRQEVCRVPESGYRCELRALGMGLGWEGDDGTRMDVPDGSNTRKQTGTILLHLPRTDTSKDLSELVM